MSKNTRVRHQLEQIFGQICMIEELGIRKIPMEERKKIKGYTKFQDKITYHHIKEKQYGGKATLENGALLKGYNHSWLHSLPQEDMDIINKKLIEYKASIMEVTEDGIVLLKPTTIKIDLSDCIEIPVYPNTKRKHKEPKIDNYNRAKEKRNLQKEIDRVLYEKDNDEYDI